MTIPIEMEPMPEIPYERCCFCRKPTPFWHVAKDVPVCTGCSVTRSPVDVPSKLDWIEKEAQLDTPCFYRP